MTIIHKTQCQCAICEWQRGEVNVEDTINRLVEEYNDLEWKHTKFENLIKEMNKNINKYLGLKDKTE